MKNIIKTLLFAFVTAGLLISCNKEPNHKEDEFIPFDENPFAVTWEDFITDEDVKILTLDTTRIAMSKKLVDKLGVTELNNRTICFWNSLSTAPFIRNVHKATLEGDNYILHSTRGTTTDLYHDTEIQFSSELYVNHDYVPTKTTRGGTNYEVDDMSGKYTDENGVLHPAYIIIENPELNDGVDDVATKSGDFHDGSVIFSAEEMLENNFEWHLVNVKDLKVGFNKKWYTSDEEGDDNQGYIDLGLYANASAQLTLYGGMKVKKCKLREFRLGIRGDVEVGAKLGLDIGMKGKKKWEDYEKTLGKTRIFFWVGPLPLWYHVSPKLVSKTELAIDAHASIYTSASVRGEYIAESYYKRGEKWGEEGSDWKHTYKATVLKKYGVDGMFPDQIDQNFGASMEISASLTKGLYWSTEVFMFDIAGPEYELGPRFGVDATAGIKVERHDKEEVEDGEVVTPKRLVAVDLEANAFVGFGGEFSVKGEVFGYKLFKLNYEYDIFRYNFLNYTASYTYDLERGTGEWENEWNAIASKNDWHGQVGDEDEPTPPKGGNGVEVGY